MIVCRAQENAAPQVSKVGVALAKGRVEQHFDVGQELMQRANWAERDGVGRASVAEWPPIAKGDRVQ